MDVTKDDCIKSWRAKVEDANVIDGFSVLLDEVKRKIENIVIPTLEKTETTRQYWVSIDVYESLFISLMSSVTYSHMDFTFFKTNNSLNIQYEINDVVEIEKLMGKSVLPVTGRND